MFALTAKIDYAIKGITYLAEFGNEAIKCETIAQARGVPLPFLRAIFADLRRAGLVGSLRGSNGGHWLLKPPHQITLLDIITAVEPIQSPADPNGDNESVQKVWTHIHHCELQILRSVSVSDLVDKADVEPATPIDLH